jgi:hypothetical protein
MPCIVVFVMEREKQKKDVLTGFAVHPGVLTVRSEVSKEKNKIQAPKSAKKEKKKKEKTVEKKQRQEAV